MAAANANGEEQSSDENVSKIARNKIGKTKSFLRIFNVFYLFNEMPLFNPVSFASLFVDFILSFIDIAIMFFISIEIFYGEGDKTLQ